MYDETEAQLHKCECGKLFVLSDETYACPACGLIPQPEPEPEPEGWAGALGRGLWGLYVLFGLIVFAAVVWFATCKALTGTAA